MPDAIEAVRADRAALLEIGRGLTAAQWQEPSGCPGWSVQDVVAHLAAGFWAMVDLSQLPDITGQPFEQGQEVWVQSMRDLSPKAVLDDYEQVSSTGLDRLAGLAGLDLQVPLGDAGTYPAALFPAAYSFDHYTHIRADLFPPRGPLAGDPPPSDELRLVPVLDWIEAALPQQNAGVLESLGGTIEIDLTGVAARTIRLGSGEPVARISSDAPAFVRWSTGRASIEEAGAEASGDAGVLDSARQIRVF